MIYLETEKDLNNLPKSLILLAGTTRLELATFPSQVTGTFNQFLNELPALPPLYLVSTLHSR
jgi:hypothetical protein